MSGVATRVEAAWSGESLADRALVTLLAPLAAGYGAGVALRNTLYDRGWLDAARVPATVVSVGNVTVGGSGKTPTVLWLADALRSRGHRVGVVGRGYGKRRPGVVVVGDGSGRALVDPADGGDEAVLAALRLSVPVVTGERRADAARAACDRFGCDTIVLDDGFQHRALARAADLVLVPADGLPARLLPAGALREPTSSLGRATALLALGDETRIPPRPSHGSAPGFAGRVVPTALVIPADGDLAPHDLALAPRRNVVAVAGVARPERFWALLDRLGIQVVARVRFPDHHAYTPDDVAHIRNTANAGDRSVLTTEKDLVKLARIPDAASLRLHAIRITVDVDEGDRLIDCLLPTK